ncbi:unnamed protein product [Rotaria magnacalcarata]|uniref:Uncharacterized protein n=4 Tax=Rotaria magnacalcarata TaxID=392030 RepID=A0A816GN58_9BILA|nr:unnamed protein product [Rotaria magnacalcarata]
MFSSTYMKPVIENGKPTESDLSSVITHTNHIGLRQHLAPNNKILLNDDADLIAETYGLYNVNDYTKEHERNVIRCGYDEFTNTSRTTGTTIIHIGDKRLTIAIAATDFHTYNKTYLPYIEINQSSMDPMIIVEKEAVIATWKWYDHHLNIAAKLFTIDPEFPGKPLSISSSILSRPKTLKQLIMLLDFNIFPVSSISVKHPLTGQTGIIKNRPALCERTLHELLQHNLLKFNYFLTDVRGRNIKSYMKIPIPSVDDPIHEQFISNLLKHEINIDEYYSIYEKSAIPLNNNLSKLALEIFEYNGSFVSQYSKYKNQLNIIIKKHVDNRHIEEAEDGHFIIKDQNILLDIKHIQH